ncbi:MAG: hypothetical protein R2764_23195 [Bacteroidales bacterium]
MRHFLLIILICLSPFCIQAKEKFLIGFSQCSAGDWRENMEAEMERELMFHEDLEIIKRQAEDSTLLQIQQIDELVKKGIDSCNNSNASNPSITLLLNEFMIPASLFLLTEKSIHKNTTLVVIIVKLGMLVVFILRVS